MNQAAIVVVVFAVFSCAQVMADGMMDPKVKERLDKAVAKLCKDPNPPDAKINGVGACHFKEFPAEASATLKSCEDKVFGKSPKDKFKAFCSDTPEQKNAKRTEIRQCIMSDPKAKAQIEATMKAMVDKKVDLMKFMKEKGEAMVSCLEKVAA